MHDTISDAIDNLYEIHHFRFTSGMGLSPAVWPGEGSGPEVDLGRQQAPGPRRVRGVYGIRVAE